MKSVKDHLKKQKDKQSENPKKSRTAEHFDPFSAGNVPSLKKPKKEPMELPSLSIMASNKDEKINIVSSIQNAAKSLAINKGVEPPSKFNANTFGNLANEKSIPSHHSNPTSVTDKAKERTSFNSNIAV